LPAARSAIRLFPGARTTYVWPLAKQYGRYGYRKIGELLRVDGWTINHEKVERIWREEGLQLPHRNKRRRRLYHRDASVIRLRPLYPNHIWSIDFVYDKLSNGRSYKMLTVLDEYTREALCVTVASRMGSAEVLEALYPLLLRRGNPNTCGPTMGRSSAQLRSRTGLFGSVSHRSRSIRAHCGRTATTNASTALCAARS
jgi:hypothetical protein